jgi:alpha-tubulin suppressor-like RCC1 family protein
MVELQGDAGSGTASPSATVTPPPPPAIVAFRNGWDSSCALLDNGQLRCFGSDLYGQAGMGRSAPGGSPGTTPDLLAPVALSRPAKTIVVNYTSACAVLDDDRLSCWGANTAGQLGAGDLKPRSMPPAAPVDLGTGRTVKAIALGGNHACAILDNDRVKCWGDNSAGQLGLGDTQARGDGPGEMGDALPYVELGAGRTATAITAGWNSSCALLDNGRVKCWGYNGYGQSGTGDTATRGDGAGEMGDNLLPIELGTGRTATKISSGYYHVCARLDDATLKCWGWGNYGGLGSGSQASLGDGAGEMGDGLLPVALGTGRTVADVSASAYSTCALLDNGALKCWGYGATGVLGQGDTSTRGDGPNEMGDNLQPINLGTGAVISSFALLGDHGCAILSTGALKCWGGNTFGALGLGDLANRGDGAGEMGDSLSAVALGTGRTALKITGWWGQTCVVLDNFQAKCWGSNDFGQAGNGPTGIVGDEQFEWAVSFPSLDLGTGRKVTQFSPGFWAWTNCAVLDNGGLKCWGFNQNGRLGLGDTEHRGNHPGEMGDALPYVDVGTGRTVRHVEAGWTNTCALLDDASVKCWGRCGGGVCGTGSTADLGDGPGEMGDALPPIDFGPGRTARSITVGAYHACAILDDRGVKCWGNNGNGRLGVGDTAHRGDDAGEMGANLPYVSLGAGRTAKAVSAGYTHTCAILDNDTLKCWGGGAYGALGNGGTADFGDGPGELGDTLQPIDLGTGRYATQVVASENFTCALLDNSTVKCWGANWGGMLGLGDMDDRGDGAGEMGDSLPALQLGTGLRPIGISSGGEQACAFFDNGRIKCWGQNWTSQLGTLDFQVWGDGPGEMGDALPFVPFFL